MMSGGGGSHPRFVVRPIHHNQLRSETCRACPRGFASTARGRADHPAGSAVLVARHPGRIRRGPVGEPGLRDGASVVRVRQYAPGRRHALGPAVLRFGTGPAPRRTRRRLSFPPHLHGLPARDGHPVAARTVLQPARRLGGDAGCGRERGDRGSRNAPGSRRRLPPVTSSSSRRAVSRAHSGSRWGCSHPGDVKGPENRRW